MYANQKNKTITIVTAKVLILGDSGVGKTGLLHRLVDDTFAATASTHGITVNRISIPHHVFPHHKSQNLIGELELWDLAGQPDYNVAHQIFLHGATLALIVIDETREAALEPLGRWIEFIRKHSPEVTAKLLVSARVDRGLCRIDNQSIQVQAKAFGFSGFFRTSAFSGHGISELRNGILESIDWSKIAWVTMPAMWQDVYRFFLRKAQDGNGLLNLDTIHKELNDNIFSKQEISTILTIMHSKGEVFVLQPLRDTKLILTDPYFMNRYGSSIVLAARSNANRPGEIDEASILRADIDISGFERLPVPEERVILDSVVSMLVEAEACYRKGGKLIFPDMIKSRGIKCFLSHNSADKTFAEDLGLRLLDKGIDVWLDKWEILAGESITSKIEEGIDDATAFIIIMSKNSMKAKWVKEELRIAIQKRIESSEFALIPILLEDCERPGFLRDYLYVDWRSPTEATFEFLLNSLRGIKIKPTKNV